MENMKIGKKESIYIFMISLLYLGYGIMQFYNGIIAWWLPWMGGSVQVGIPVLDTYIPNAFPDVFSGLVLLTVGVVLLRAVYLNHLGDEKYHGYLFVGWLLAIILMILNILVIIADILDAYYPLLWGEVIEEGWSLAGDAWGIAPHLILGLFLTPFYPKMKNILIELSPMKYKIGLAKKEV